MKETPTHQHYRNITIRTTVININMADRIQ